MSEFLVRYILQNPKARHKLSVWMSFVELKTLMQVLCFVCRTRLFIFVWQITAILWASNQKDSCFTFRLLDFPPWVVLSEVAMDVVTFVAFRIHYNWLLVRFPDVNLEAPNDSKFAERNWFILNLCLIIRSVLAQVSCCIAIGIFNLWVEYCLVWFENICKIFLIASSLPNHEDYWTINSFNQTGKMILACKVKNFSAGKNLTFPLWRKFN